MDNIKILVRNKKAKHEYFIEESLEAGIALKGTEVKSIRMGKVNFLDSYVTVFRNEAILRGMHVSPYEKGNIFNKDPLRERKLLLHKKEILKLEQKISQDGYSIIPLEIYLNKSLVKVKIGICKGKKLYDKRQSLKESDAKRKMDKALKER